MNLCETFFIDDKPVGVIRLDSNTNQFAFSPVRGNSPLPEREWWSVDELKASILEAYKKNGEVLNENYTGADG